MKKYMSVFKSKRLLNLLIIPTLLIPSLSALLQPTTTAAAAPTMQIVRSVSDYETLGVVNNVAYAVRGSDTSPARSKLYRSFDEGATWQLAAAFPSQVWNISSLPSGTLFASTNSGSSGQIIWRSTNQGTTWQNVSLQDPSSVGKPATYSSTMPGTPYVYQLLTNHSITYDGQFAYIGSYNQSQALYNNTNYIYRSSDDGQTWQITNVSTTHRHIHSVHVGPDGKLYLTIGDDAGADGVFVSSDHGVTMQPVCSGRTDAMCITVAFAFDGQGNAVYVNDQAYGPDQIVRLNLSTGQPTSLGNVSYEGFTGEQLQDGSFLMGNNYEANGLHNNDPNIHLYSIVGNTVTSIYATPIISTTRIGILGVAGQYSNGDVAIYQSDMGTMFVHVNTGLSSQAPPVNTSLPTITGTAQVGQTLNANVGNWTANPAATYSYQWQRCNGSTCANVAGISGPAYTLLTDDQGYNMQVIITATNSSGTATATSAQTALVAPAPAPPVNTAPPVLTGNAQVGQTLTTSNGSWTNSPTLYEYQWVRCDIGGASCAGIPGYLTSSYTLQSADVGSTIRSMVVASNGGGPSQQIKSAQTAVVSVVPPSNVTLPAVSGSPQVGQLLSADFGAWAGSSPLAYTYQWQSCVSATCSNIASATNSSYVLTSAELNKTVRVAVTASNGAGSASANSAQTAPVQIATVAVSHDSSASFGIWSASDSQNITVGAQSNRLMVFEFAGKLGADSIFTATYGGQPLTRLSAQAQGSTRLETWYLLNPPTGTATLNWTKTGSSQNDTWGVDLFSGVDQTNPFGAVVTGGGTMPTNNTQSLTVASGNGEMVLDTAVFNGVSTSTGPTASSNQTTGWSRNVSTTQGGSATTAGASSVTVGWTPSVASNYDWAMMAVPVKPANAAPPTVPSNTALPILTGLAQVGQTLGTSNGSWSGTTPMIFTYQWQRCNGSSCSNIAGATAAYYTLAAADLGMTVQAVVTATNTVGNASSTSSPTAVVAAVPQPPVNVSAPIVSGTTQIGQTLTTSNGTWTNSPSSYLYQWLRCNSAGSSCANISGAGSPSYTLQAADVGSTIKSQVTANNGGGTSSPAVSSQTAIVTAVAPVNTSVPVVSGNTQVGQTLSASTGSWTGNPTPTYAYQWQSCVSSVCSNIAGATSSTYVLTSSELTKTIRVIVTGTNIGGNSSANSAQTAAVTVATAAVKHDSSSSYSIWSTGDSQSVTVGTNSNRLLVFTFAGKLGTDAITSVTYGSQTLTKLSAQAQGSTRLEIWYLVNPTSGTAALSWTKTGSSQNDTWGVDLFSGVNQTNPFGTVVSGSGTMATNNTQSLTVASATGDMVFDASVFNGAATTAGPTASANQTKSWSRNQSTTQGGTATATGASSVTVGWTPSVVSNYDWAMMAVSVKAG